MQAGLPIDDQALAAATSVVLVEKNSADSRHHFEQISIGQTAARVDIPGEILAEELAVVTFVSREVAAAKLVEWALVEGPVSAHVAPVLFAVEKPALERAFAEDTVAR